MRLRLDRRSGGFVLTYPKRVGVRRALLWAEGHRGWMRETAAAVPPAAPIADGGSLMLEGLPHLIRWEVAASRVPQVSGGIIHVGGPCETLQPRLLRWLRRLALERLSADTAFYAERAGVCVSRIGVGDPVSRWGSCSASGAIRYSWRLVLAPAFVRRATAAHEVAHRVHMNHGPAFHALVADLLGEDPAPARLWLRRNGAALHGIGRE